jgi:universal stress protein E
MQPIDKIVVAVADPGHRPTSTLSRAVRLAECYGADVELFTCVYNQYLAGERFFDTPGLERARKTLVGLRQKELDALAADLATAEVKVSTSAAWDYPVYEGIVRHVMESAADLLVVESTARSKLQRAQLSNTDWQLVRTCPCPLLLVKSEESCDYENVVAAVDPMHDHDKPAHLDHKILEAAASFAEVCSGQLEVFHAFKPITATSLGPEVAMLPVDYTEEMLERTHLDELHELTGRHGIPASSVHLRGGATEKALADFVAARKSSLVVMGAVSRNMLKRLFIGSTAENVLDRLDCDVLVIKPDGFESKVKAEHRHTVTETSDIQGLV